uniref:ADAM metallopeptidase with thrombospondin type 1 motif 7 n=1 Tax=Takifugu rubripes TaxID=31033 RepID=A0A674MB76_TAKRU
CCASSAAMSQLPFLSHGFVTHLLFPPWFSTERLLLDLPQYDVVHPTRVDARGHFLSNFLSHHARRVQRREAPEGSANMDRVFYQLWHSNHSLRFNLTLNTHLLAPGFLTERRYGGLEGAKMQTAASSQCHFLGEVWDEDSVKGSAAISTCDGLTGLFRLSKEEFFIQPLQKSTLETSAPQAHAIYKRHVTSPSWNPSLKLHRERWERRRLRKRRRIRQRSVSKEKWVETLVVADPKMVEYHGSTAVENYILAVMNIVSGLFGDASIGNAINVVVVRLILLEQDEDDLKITHHADNSLHSFCKWQKKLNMKGDDHPLHHDVSVLLTRKDICAAINMPCETLGLSHVAGMCQAHRSCSISEDTGLPVAFTVAHELGHNFGIQHDGNGNDCEPVGKRPFVMSPQLLYGTSLPQWSRCSREYITRFLDRGWGWCLDDAPVKDKHSWNSVLPGVVYTAVHQCRLQYGPSSRLCDDMDNVCSTLWCTVGTTCHSKLDGAVDGTSCGEDKWCFRGECLHVGHQPAMINGGWGSWSEWSACSRTCGAGVQNAHRDCDNPVPKYRGTYCLGERRRYKICNITPCPQEVPTFRDVQCGHFNVLPYKGTFYKWETVFNKASPCELHCRPLNENFSEKLRDAVTDGTLCYEGNKSRDMCINGICMKVGCDYVVESSAVEDRCGVCNGDGSTCTTVRRTFEESEGLGYVDIGLIPEGARDIRIEEVAEAGNFLALRSDNPNKYFLNGGWTIQWNGDYKAAGTIFTYERTRHLENLTSPGPTTEPLWIQLLFQEPNPGVRYEYTINRNTSGNNSLPTSSFSWKFGSWTECSATCGAGVQRQIVHCVERTTGIVEEHWCDPLTRPDDNQTSCQKDPCPAVWWIGKWQKCSASCGGLGQTKRTVLCIQAVSAEEQKALPSRECEHVPKPASLSSCNTHIPCPADWTAGNWSKVSLDQHYEPFVSKFRFILFSGFILNHSDFSPTYATGRYSWDTDFNPTTASLSEEYMPTPLPYLQISGNHQASDISTSSGTATEPPTALEGATQVSPADLLPAVRKYDPTEPPSAERGGAEFSPQASWLDLEALDETPMPVMVTERSIGLPSAHPDPPTSTRPAVFWPTLLPTSVQTTASPQGTFSGYWITGNWSACSTSCGLGAIWRALSCSSGSDSDCDPAKRPAPAQRCYLRPCASWKVQEWSKCSRNCGGGAKTREVTCIDMRDERSLRPFHCRAVSSRPQTHLSCNLQPCLDWYASSWGQCSEVCGGGEQQRVVTCPEEDRCDLDLQPSRIQSCNNQLCVQWLTGSWGQCSTSCGGGVQRRLIKCINTKAETEVDASKCDHDLQPASTQKCNVQKCERTSSGPVCVRDRLTSRFCKTLLWLGRCQLPNIRAQCCKTCSQRSRVSCQNNHVLFCCDTC